MLVRPLGTGQHLWKNKSARQIHTPWNPDLKVGALLALALNRGAHVNIEVGGSRGRRPLEQAGLFFVPCTVYIYIYGPRAGPAARLGVVQLGENHGGEEEVPEDGKSHAPEA